MTNRRCSKCCFGDKCQTRGSCEYYAPLDEESEFDLDGFIENRRTWFARAWLEYIDEDNE